ncbi:hypothetical protein BX600DRAFT_430306 [Xylariales sp. PMI_506]|nr:hypothetical protein BX600DRAFT_430306 [Xylariales sp. PMI_506]
MGQPKWNASVQFGTPPTAKGASSARLKINADNIPFQLKDGWKAADPIAYRAAAARPIVNAPSQGRLLPFIWTSLTKLMVPPTRKTLSGGEYVWIGGMLGETKPTQKPPQFSKLPLQSLIDAESSPNSYTSDANPRLVNLSACSTKKKHRWSHFARRAMDYVN